MRDRIEHRLAGRRARHRSSGRLAALVPEPGDAAIEGSGRDLIGRLGRIRATPVHDTRKRVAIVQLWSPKNA